MSAINFGSSHFTGKRCFYLEEEVVVIPVAISHSLDDLDLVIHSLQHTGMHPVNGAGDNAFNITLETVGKLLNGCQSAAGCQVQPVLPALPGFSF